MVICPRCEQQVDETVRTTCPLCFTPLPGTGSATAELEQAPPPPARHLPTMPPAAMPAGSAPQAPTLPPMPAGTSATPPAVPPMSADAPVAPPAATPLSPEMPAAAMPQAPAAPPPAARPGGRVSLTGEVYDQAMQDTAPPPSYVGGNLPPAHPAQSTRESARSITRRLPDEPRAKSGGGGNVAVVVVLVLALLGGGGWWFLNKRTNPKDQAHKYALAQKAQDWNTIYNLTYLNAEDKAKFPNAEAMKQEFDKNIAQVDSNPMAKAVGLTSEAIRNAFNTAEIKSVGEPTYAEGEATVPVVVSVSIMGRTTESTQQVKLKNEMGVWKVIPELNMPNLGGGTGAGGFGR